MQQSLARQLLVGSSRGSLHLLRRCKRCRNADVAADPAATTAQCTCRHFSATRPTASAVLQPGEASSSSSIQLDTPSRMPQQQPLSSPITPKSSPSTSSLFSHQPPTSRSSTHTSQTALALLRSQPSHYIVASLYLRRYLLTPRDLLTVPRLKDVKVGDVIQLEKIHELGSRDYTMRASLGEVLDPKLVQCNLTVVEHTCGAMEEIVKFKRRKGYKKTIKHKARYTKLRVGDIVVGGAEA